MFVKWIKFIVLALLSAALFYIMHNGIQLKKGSPIPAFGKLLDPFNGLWKNNQSFDNVKDNISLTGVAKEVQVLWDDRKVPHIVANTDQDLFFTQGYMAANDRLWQMDFMSRAALGRLSEVVGPKAIELDRFNKRIGLKKSAQDALDTLRTIDADYQLLQAYVNGVNAKIAELKYKNYPIEFKILNYAPEEWTPLKSLAILKYMAWDLDGGTSEKFINGAREVLGEEKFNALYPIIPPEYDPIIKEHTGQPIKAVEATDSIGMANGFLGNIAPEPDGDGSNNWVVGSTKTRSGYPILADDPHLTLRLPSLWYENQLFGPNINAYGVSIPGMPGIVIGFNEDVSWGLTYATSDVIDYYKIDINRDGKTYNTAAGNQPFTYHLDTIFVRNEQPVIDTTLMTVFGPLVYQEQEYKEAYFNANIPAGAAMQWTAHLPSLEMSVLFEMLSVKNKEEFFAGISNFNAPGQNFVFASEKDIALWHNGLFPSRSYNEGRFVAEAADVSGPWDTFIPRNAIPQTVNPTIDYISSANQPPTNLEHGYLGGDEYAYYGRGSRINEVLDTLNSITPYDIQLLQLDVLGHHPRRVLPTLLDNVKREKLTPEQDDVFREIADWNYKYEAQFKSPTLFTEWLKQITIDIWRDEFNETDIAHSWPREDFTLEMLVTDSTAVYYDNILTENVVENRESIIHDAFVKANDSLVAKLGGLNESWEWGRSRGTNINHFAGIEAFGRQNLYTSGHNHTVNSIKGNHGPSWRMVVEMSKPIKAYGIYPGGQSGNPGSAYYDNFIDDWVNGIYYDIVFLTSPTTNNSIVNTTSIKPK